MNFIIIMMTPPLQHPGSAPGCVQRPPGAHSHASCVSRHARFPYLDNSFTTSGAESQM